MKKIHVEIEVDDTHPSNVCTSEQENLSRFEECIQRNLNQEIFHGEFVVTSVAVSVSE